MIKRTIYISTPCALKMKDNQLVVQYNHIKGQENKADKTVPIEDIGFLILEHDQITLTHRMIAALLENNVALITSNTKMLPTGLILNLNGNTLQGERFRWQIEASEPLKKQLWSQIVKQKIINQSFLLECENKEIKKMFNLADSVLSGDESNNEAQAAVYYWQHIFAPSWNFKRDREGTPPNNLLNYGYTILRAIMARSLVGSGLLPTLGIFHRNRYNAYALADDMMEPYRPFVDKIVLDIIHSTSNIDPLSIELKSKLLQIPTMDVKLEKETSPLMIATQRTAASLVRCFEGERRKLLLPSMI